MKLATFAVVAAVLTVAALLRDAGETYAGHGVPIQTFSVDARICYGAEPASTTFACPGTSETNIATPGAAITSYYMTSIEIGSPLADSALYTPADWTSTPASAGDIIGNATARVEVICDFNPDLQGDYIDIVAGSYDDVSGGYSQYTHSTSFDVSPWPDSHDGHWPPYYVRRLGTTLAPQDGYILVMKQTPPSFPLVSYERGLFNWLWLSGAVPTYLTGLAGYPARYDIITETMPYPAAGGLRVTTALKNVQPAPPTQTLECFDSPEDFLVGDFQTVAPAVAGLYPRWTVFASRDDIRSGTRTRAVDLSCVTVGVPTVTDADGDCLAESGAEDTDADRDDDGLVDGIEAEYGSSPTAVDSDGDGATDFDEMVAFTDPNDPDTDGDGSLDLPDNGADENSATSAVVDDTTADDNCPAAPNPTQQNTDAQDLPNGTTGDKTNGTADTSGDDCDIDDDNDDSEDVFEPLLDVTDSDPYTKCAKDPDTPAVADGDETSATDADTDDDLALDGRECKFNSNPVLATSRPPAAGPDLLEDGYGEINFRTQGINQPPEKGAACAGALDDDGDGRINDGCPAVGAAESDPNCVNATDDDGDGAINDGCPSAPSHRNPDGDSFLTGDADNDSDNDGLLDGVEVKMYGSKPSDSDSDHDGCSDGHEAASINLDRSVTSADLSAIAQRFGPYRNATTGVVDVTKATYDFNKDATIASADLSAVAQRFGSCPAQKGYGSSWN